MKKPSNNNSIITWLSVTAFMVLAMAVIGAITRLTESGLSMVEWRPLIGALPPLNEQEWQRVFSLYKETPEFIHHNAWMELHDFKKIFFWEWLHRLWGRTIGLVYTLPLIVFWIRGLIPSGYKTRLFILLLLGGGQGVMGWIMVQSGLIDRPSVSHFRLAAHLFLAVILFSGLVWTIFDLKYGKAKWSWDGFCLIFMRSNATQASAGLPVRHSRADAQNNNRLFCLRRHGIVSLLLLFTTIIWGAFVAGLDGGMIYNSWPLMGGKFFPDELAHNNAILENPAGVQFFHRWIAIIAGLSIITYAMRVKSKVLGIMVFVQIGLGVATIMSQVVIPLAALHQATAFILLLLLLLSIHNTFEAKKGPSK